MIFHRKIKAITEPTGEGVSKKILKYQEGFDNILFCTEYYGDSFFDILRQNSLDLFQIKKYAHQILTIVNNIHRLQVVHADIKPSNICLNNRGEITLIDFGLAFSIPTSSSSRTFVQTAQY